MELTINKLTTFLDACLKRCEYADSTHKELFFHQAFGAVCFYQEAVHNANIDKELEELWENNYRPKFNKMIWGL